MTISSYEGIPDRSLVGVGRGQEEGGDHPVWVDCQRDLEAVDPLGFGAAPPEGGLSGEKPLAAGPHPQDGRDEGGVQNAIDGRRIAELSGEVVVQGAQFGLQGADAPVELALGAQGGEVGTQV